MIDGEDLEMFSMIIANEKTCRMFLEKIEERGASYGVDIKTLDHRGCQELALKVLEQTLRNEEQGKRDQYRQ